MSNSPIPSDSGRCFDQPRALKAIKQCHWLEVAAILTAVVLAVTAVVAFMHVGSFAALGANANYMAYGLAGAVGLIVLGELIHKAITYCKLKPTQNHRVEKKKLAQKPKKDKEAVKKEESPKPVLKEISELPETPLKERLGPKEGEALKHTDTVYSKKRPATEKLAIQLDYAIREGMEGKKKKAAKTFKINLEDDVSKYEDSSIKLASAGAAETANFPIRRSMEDAHVAIEIEFKGQVARFIGVFDGHGDRGEAAAYLRDHLPTLLSKELEGVSELSDEAITNALTKVLVKLDEPLKEIGGTTATCSLILEDGRVYVPNIGDSRTILVRRDAAYQLSEDAEPIAPRFEHAVIKMGHQVPKSKEGYMINFYNRVNGDLAVARDLGEGILSPRPKITRIDKGIEDNLEETKIGYQAGDYLILACDGLWDVCTVQEAFKAVNTMAEAGVKPSQMAAHLVKGALEAGSTDNISVVVVKL